MTTGSLAKTCGALVRGLLLTVGPAVGLAFGLAGAAAPAHAGDFARTEMLGFSADGSHFAFEEYGIQDGSGFPYSTIYVIDTNRDSWVPGSPFRRLDEIDDSQGPDLAAELERTRSLNRESASALLEQTGIAGLGETLGHNPPTERLADPFRMKVTLLPEAPGFGEPVSLRLEEYPLAGGASCPQGLGDTQGFRLTLEFAGESRVLNSDSALPASRGCPLRYRIERFVAHRASPGARPHFAVLVLMEVIGFEGPSGRYLAITGRL
jgi:predicted secreted protein